MDRAKIEEFLDSFTEMAAGATTIGLLAVADRSGLSAWLGEHGGGTSEEIANGAGLQERYVREILSGLAASEILDYDPDTKRFDLPPEHALFLSSELSPYFMGGWFDMLPASMAQLDAIATATREGGGVSFDEFGTDLITGLDRLNGPSQRVFLTSRWLPRVPGLPERLDEGIRIADIGCGAGTVAALIAEAYPRCQIVGFDVSAQSIDLARNRTGHLPNVEFHLAGIEEVPTDPPFDLVTTFDVIHDLVDPAAGLRHIHEALAPGGMYLMMEPAASSRLEENINPRGALLYGVSALHCMTQSLALGGEGLGAAWGSQLAEEYARNAGFTEFDYLEAISNKFSSFYLLKP